MRRKDTMDVSTEERHKDGLPGKETQGAVVCETLMCGGAGMYGIPGHISSVQDETSTGAE